MVPAPGHRLTQEAIRNITKDLDHKDIGEGLDAGGENDVCRGWRLRRPQFTSNHILTTIIR